MKGWRWRIFFWWDILDLTQQQYDALVVSTYRGYENHTEDPTENDVDTYIFEHYADKLKEPEIMARIIGNSNKEEKDK